ncbi:ribosomal maturation YjgA family protein [Microbispora bryophytorum]|uniref:Membrane protein n=1 Tax=Microbispora bryophytorum TaxID=1460882 RepID=A0A8H9LAS0_9ACTN|nr:DUF2809 domain-containing protein [Microbispora bryophytorum]MBD3135373.1 DUF2809 domain-containing protein [Microbispora bryophytorum]TQS09574.1 DUF2809 domain-containing protein [Microbispora bryophytorum]GGN97279.1 membrane protein [Microbispora bryophytorum]
MPHRRLAALAAAVVVVVAGLSVRALLPGMVGKYAGDLLYTLLVYALVVVAAPRARPFAVAAVALGVSWLVEFAQLTGVPAALSAHSTTARLVLGTTFNGPDLFWYAGGAAVGYAIHRSVLSTIDRFCRES